ncbi:cobalt/nickel transport system permease protein [Anaerobacterium chartisolvens]|uniref:Cobalt/nickel transport system permease protein n=1 Tax=Anaerobacterium chartisolvens TaxID=1297424 RepID=A0A369B7T1_9FIRM|nr:cobalt ECF transporter T component CbiQ [Anaerobacterium chartisolvens]RCX16606.1 cobalt/nickel transport system permease protein [Anaerobacterium chartisolvens]
MLSIDKYAYSSKLAGIDPMQKLFFTFITLGVCLWANDWVISLLVIFIAVGAAVIKGGIPIRIFAKMLLIPMVFLVIGVLSIAINASSSAEFFLISVQVAGTAIGITSSGAINAFNLFIKAIGSVSCLYFLSLTTPITDLLDAMRRLKVPRLFTELMGLIYRFIFVLLERSGTMFTAQSSRLGYSTLSTGYRSLAALASTLFIDAYRRSDELYTSLEARGYEGELRVLPRSYNKSRAGYICTAVLNILLICTALALRHL